MATVTVMPIVLSNNVQPVIVDAGPAGLNPPSVNEAFVTITICVPGSTTQCQTIDHVLVDTGSSGLRLLSSTGGGELGLTLPPANDSSGNPLYECVTFLDGYIWGSVSTADITVAGEKASSANVHVVIPASAAPAPPGTCVSRNTLPGGMEMRATASVPLARTACSESDCSSRIVVLPHSRLSASAYVLRLSSCGVQ